MLLPVNDVLYPCFLVADSFAFVVRAEFQVRRRSRCVSVVKLPRNWIFQPLVKPLCSCPSFASEICPVNCSQSMNKHACPRQMYAAKQARNEETRECATVSGRDLVLLLGKCADNFEIYIYSQIEF